MKDPYVSRNRQSSSVMYANRRYLKKGLSPSPNTYVSSCLKSNNEISISRKSQIPLSRGQKSQNDLVNCNRQDLLMSYQLIGISDSNNLKDGRKKMRSGYYKRVGDLNGSEMVVEEKARNTKEFRKKSLHGLPFAKEGAQSDIEQLHFTMVQFQQKCKKMISK